MLQLLDLLKDVEEYTDYCCEKEAPDIIRRHIQRNNILRADVDKYIENFPLKTYKNIYDLRLTDVLAPIAQKIGLNTRTIHDECSSNRTHSN